MNPSDQRDRDNEHATPQDSPLLVGIDWADEKHDLTIIEPGRAPRHMQVDANPQDVENMIAELRNVASGRKIAVCLEKGRVRIIHQLLFHDDITLYPIDPKQVARYRESFKSSKAKDDGHDSYYLARMLEERRDQLEPMKLDDPLTRRISLLSETRRTLVNNKTSVIQQLIAKIKLYHPLVFTLPTKQIESDLVQEFIRRFPDPRAIRKARKQTLRKFFIRHGIKDTERVEELITMLRETPLATSDASLIEPLVIHVQALTKQIQQLQATIKSCEQELKKAMSEHPDAQLFRVLPGAGDILAPRLLALFGSDRERYADADALGSYVGIAPVTVQSGKKRKVSRRRACPKFLLQTFHEFAGCARRFCPWSGAYYRWQRSKGVGHHAALRKLATRWARILFQVWQKREPYDEGRYMASMHEKQHPLIAFLITE